MCPAPKGNCNAAKNQALCKAGANSKNKGWYNRSGASKYLKKTFDTENLVPYLSKSWGRTASSRNEFTNRFGISAKDAKVKGDLKRVRYIKRLHQSVTSKWSKHL